MSSNVRIIPCAVAVIGALLAGPAHSFSVNQSIHVEPGSESGGHSTVNGSITIASDAVVDGSVETVNGRITIDDNVRVRGVSTVNGSIRAGSGLNARTLDSVNGSIRVGGNAAIEGEVAVVNGGIEIGPGSSVGKDVSNVNGDMRIEGTEIGGDLRTVSGDILLTAGSVLRGDLVIEKPNGWGWGWRKTPKIVIGPGTRVLGSIRAEYEIDLYISESAEVAGVSGEASLDEAVRFSGDQP